MNKAREAISKELLQEILESKSKITRSELEENELLFYLMPENGVGFGRTINIYELMSMAKEWAFLKGYTIISHLTKPRLSNDIVSEDLIMSKSVIKRNNGELIRLFKLKAPEYYAVFQACQYILDKELK